jgi:hypothetical protein
MTRATNPRLVIQRSSSPLPGDLLEALATVDGVSRWAFACRALPSWLLHWGSTRRKGRILTVHAAE